VATATTVRVRRVVQSVRVRRPPPAGGPRVRRVVQTVRTREGSAGTTVRVRQVVQVARVRSVAPATVRLRRSVTTARVRSGAGSGSVATHAPTHRPGGSDPLVVNDPKDIHFENPTAAENAGYFFAHREITVVSLRGVLVGSLTPSVTFTVRFAPNRSDVGTELDTGGTVVTSTGAGDLATLAVTTIPANSWVWVRTTAKSGTVDELTVTMDYTA